MTTSQNTFLYEILAGQQIPAGKLAYFRSRLRNRIHSLVLEEFARLEKDGKISRAVLGRRIGKKPEQITRWLAASGNWTIDTLSDLCVGMAVEPGLSLNNLAEMAKPQGITLFWGATGNMTTSSTVNHVLMVDQQMAKAA